MVHGVLIALKSFGKVKSIFQIVIRNDMKLLPDIEIERDMQRAWYVITIPPLGSFIITDQELANARS